MRKIFAAFVFLLLIPLVLADTVDIPTTSNYLPATDTANIIIKSVNYDPTPAEPGKYIDIFVVIQNLGNKDLDKSWLKLEEDYPFSFDINSDSIEEVDLIPSGREELLEYRMRVDDQAIEGDYELELIHCADANCNTELRESSFSIKVRTGGKPKLEIGLEDSSIFLPDTLGEVTISAVNRDKLGIKFLTIELMEGEGYEVVSPARVYIGELNSDDFETEDFQVYINSASSINIPIKVEYSDENFKDYAGVEEVTVKVFTEEKALAMGLTSKSNTLRHLTISAIVLLFLIFLYKRRKSKNEH